MSDNIINKEILDLLIGVSKSWNELSSNPEATWCMTDHCHNEYDLLDDLIIRLTERIEATK